MKGALGKKELLAVVPLSWSTIDRTERAGEFPKRWYITDKRCAWNRDEVERWLDERQAASPAEFQGKKTSCSATCISSREQRCMSALLRNWIKWSGWYLFLASVSAWLYLLALIFREGWIK